MLTLHVWSKSGEERCEFPGDAEAVTATWLGMAAGQSFSGQTHRRGIGSANHAPAVLALVSRPKTPSLLLGISLAAAVIVVETLIVCSLNILTGTTGHFGTLYLIGVLVVSTVWGIRLVDDDVGRLTLPAIRAALKRGGRQRGIDTKAGEIATSLRAEQLETAAPVTAAFAATPAPRSPSSASSTARSPPSRPP